MAESDEVSDVVEELAELQLPQDGQQDKDVVLQKLNAVLSTIFNKDDPETDPYFRELVNQSDSLYIRDILKAPSLQEITSDEVLIRQAISDCKAIVSSGGVVHPVGAKPEQKTLILGEIAPTASSSDILSIFVNAVTSDGSPCPGALSVRSDMNDTWFVTFASENDAKAALSAIRGCKIHGQLIRSRLKTESFIKSAIMASHNMQNQMKQSGTISVSEELSPDVKSAALTADALAAFSADNSEPFHNMQTSLHSPPRGYQQRSGTRSPSLTNSEISALGSTQNSGSVVSASTGPLSSVNDRTADSGNSFNRIGNTPPYEAQYQQYAAQRYAQTQQQPLPLPGPQGSYPGQPPGMHNQLPGYVHQPNMMNQQTHTTVGHGIAGYATHPQIVHAGNMMMPSMVQSSQPHGQQAYNSADAYAIQQQHFQQQQQQFYLQQQPMQVQQSMYQQQQFQPQFYQQSMAYTQTGSPGIMVPTNMIVAANSIPTPVMPSGFSSNSQSPSQYDRRYGRGHNTGTRNSPGDRRNFNNEGGNRGRQQRGGGQQRNNSYTSYGGNRFNPNHQTEPQPAIEEHQSSFSSAAGQPSPYSSFERDDVEQFHPEANSGLSQQSDTLKSKSSLDARTTSNISLEGDDAVEHLSNDEIVDDLNGIDKNLGNETSSKPIPKHVNAFENEASDRTIGGDDQSSLMDGNNEIVSEYVKDPHGADSVTNTGASNSFVDEVDVNYDPDPSRTSATAGDTDRSDATNSGNDFRTFQAEQQSNVPSQQQRTSNYNDRYSSRGGRMNERSSSATDRDFQGKNARYGNNNRRYNSNHDQQQGYRYQPQSSHAPSAYQVLQQHNHAQHHNMMNQGNAQNVQVVQGVQGIQQGQQIQNIQQFQMQQNHHIQQMQQIQQAQMRPLNTMQTNSPVYAMQPGASPHNAITYQYVGGMQVPMVQSSVGANMMNVPSQIAVQSVPYFGQRLGTNSNDGTSPRHNMRSPQSVGSPSGYATAPHDPRRLNHQHQTRYVSREDLSSYASSPRINSYGEAGVGVSVHRGGRGFDGERSPHHQQYQGGRQNRYQRDGNYNNQRMQRGSNYYNAHYGGRKNGNDYNRDTAGNSNYYDRQGNNKDLSYTGEERDGQRSGQQSGGPMSMHHHEDVGGKPDDYGNDRACDEHQRSSPIHSNVQGDRCDDHTGGDNAEQYNDVPRGREGSTGVDGGFEASSVPVTDTPSMS